ncbi:MAG: anthranilate synthase component I [Actinomycetes bacterium]
MIDVFPSLEDFVSLAQSHKLIPVAREMVADTLTPVRVFLAAVGEEDGFLLESVEGGERWGRYSFVGRSPLATIVSQAGTITSRSHGDLTIPKADGILDLLDQLISSTSTPPIDGLPPLHSGVVGYLGYDVVREIEMLLDPPKDDLELPDACMSVIGEIVAFDHWRQRITLIANVAIPDGCDDDYLTRLYADAVVRLDTLGADCDRPIEETTWPAPVTGPHRPLAKATPTMSSETFMRAVEVAKDYVTAGDIFQVVLSKRFDIEGEVDPFAVYRALRLLNPSPYLYFLRTEGVHVAGSSPEPMVRLRDGVVTSRPIAGSRPRGHSEIEDDRLAAELLEDPKELAEHVMLVDLARNDVGRVVQFGSERVEELMTLERYSHVMHITSQVAGDLAEGKGPIDVLRATLPAGTLSGAPKVRAMQIIDELEPTRRSVYGGVVGYLDFTGNIDTAIAIRTMIVTPDGRASVQAGAGVVADSDPASEDAECANKAAAVLAAVAASRVEHH